MSPEGIAMKDLEHMIRQIVRTNTITFSKDELVTKGTRHIKSLHIAVECKGVIIS